MQNGKFKIDVVAIAPGRREAEALRTKYISRRRRTKATLNERIGLAGRRATVSNYPGDPDNYVIVRISNKDWVYYGATSNLKGYFGSINQQMTNPNVPKSRFAGPMKAFGVENLDRSYDRALKTVNNLTLKQYAALTN